MRIRKSFVIAGISAVFVIFIAALVIIANFDSLRHKTQVAFYGLNEVQVKAFEAELASVTDKNGKIVHYAPELIFLFLRQELHLMKPLLLFLLKRWIRMHWNKRCFRECIRRWRLFLCGMIRDGFWHCRFWLTRWRFCLMHRRFPKPE